MPVGKRSDIQPPAEDQSFNREFASFYVFFYNDAPAP